jgi:hypothetical protein
MHLYKKYMALITIAATFNLAVAMHSDDLVTLPSAEIIKSRLLNLGLKHFCEKTEIDQKLGSQQVYPEQVAEKVEESITHYAQYIKNPMMISMISAVNLQHPNIIREILKDSPKAISDLKEAGLLD